MTRILREHRSTLLVTAAVLLILLLAVVTGTGADSGEPLDPDGHGPGGGRATAQVLRAHGVDVRVARDARALEALAPGAGTTVLVTSTGNLGESTATGLLEVAGEATTVVVEPGPALSDALSLPTGVPVLSPDTAAGCDDPRFSGLDLAVDRAVAYPTAQGCFRVEDGHLLGTAEGGLLVLGAGELLSNDQVLRADNAAVAVRLLGGNDHLVWYVPDLADLRASDGVRLSTLLPDWLVPGLWLASVAVVALLLWQGRRLGPLVREPLPVAVRAIETTQSRGRLYRKARDRAHAAHALRAATAEDAVRHLHLPAQSAADPDRLVRDLAHHTGHSGEELGQLLGTGAPVPATDQELITLAGRLAELDREVRAR